MSIDKNKVAEQDEKPRNNDGAKESVNINQDIRHVKSAWIPIEF